MKYVAAVLLVQLSGKTPDAKNVKKVLSSVGAAVDEDKLSSLLDKLEGQNIKSVIASGLGKLSSVPTGAVGGGAPSAGGGGPANSAATEEKKEEPKKEEPEEESDDDMGFGLFD